MNKRVPEIRFVGFSNDWEMYALKDVVTNQIKGKAQFEKLHSGDVEYLDTSRLNGAQPVFTDGVKDVTRDDIIILWDGSKAGTVYIGYEGALGSTLKGFRTKSYAQFVYQLLKKNQEYIYNNYRTPNIPHVQKDFLEVFKITIPNIQEQQKIGSFFKQLDNLIDLHQRKLALLKEQKKGFLQKMFPQDGAMVLEVRFAGFSGDWAMHKLGNLINVHSGRDYKHLNKGNVPVYGTGGYMTSVDEALSQEVDAIGIGRKGTIDKPYILRAPFWTVDTLFFAIPENGNDLNFINSIFQQINWKQYDESTGVPSLSKKTINQVQVIVPTSIEQQKIGAFFKKLDDVITFQERKLDLLKEQKKGFLQRMFV
ncbi:restriction endonuclease subunit S [Weissella soli]|uniref:Type I restriction enzyme S subunit n=1 Tax=Weissella soli TaxID=155866 RepID=A0A288QTL8_9LACO|nr:restriction endonuclease subunit S [Weissella soli]AOT56398.1 Type I site-specific deoxyribonuclease [Weissella soli]NKY82850.1 restriction endonuclease subunit S [Weissella soli]RDL11967.1 type I restriction enzyme S subunit [Weissella soli]GEN92803.1 hypothetical protein WSO01_04150 [Weissella soli]